MDPKQLDPIVSALLKSYELDHAERPRLPSLDAVVRVMDQIRRILFPGYYAEVRLPADNRNHYVSTWLCELNVSMVTVLKRAYGHAAYPGQHNPDEPKRVAALFVGALPGLREQLRADAEAALVGDPAAQSVEEVILTYPGFQAIMVHRISHWLHTHGVPFIPRILSEHAHSSTGIDIHPGARIGRRFFIDHGTGVVIGETTDIGDGVKIYQGVTLGALSVERGLAGSKRHPTLGDNVIIYAGATVLGGDTVVGQNAVIGGNVWLTESVETGTTVLETRPMLDYRPGQEREA